MGFHIFSHVWSGILADTAMACHGYPDFPPHCRHLFQLSNGDQGLNCFHHDSGYLWVTNKKIKKNIQFHLKNIHNEVVIIYIYTYICTLGVQDRFWNSSCINDIFGKQRPRASSEGIDFGPIKKENMTWDQRSNEYQTFMMGSWTNLLVYEHMTLGQIIKNNHCVSWFQLCAYLALGQDDWWLDWWLSKIKCEKLQVPVSGLHLGWWSMGWSYLANRSSSVTRRKTARYSL